MNRSHAGLKSTLFRSIFLIAMSALAACSSSGNTASSTPPTTAIPFGFVSGALYDALGDSVTAPYGPPNQSIVNYPRVAITVSGLSITLHDLADGHSNFIGGYQSCHSGANGPLRAQIARIDPGAGFVAIETGIDEAAARAEDVLHWHCRNATPDQDAAAMLTEYLQALSQIRVAAPFAQIVLFDDGNITHFPCSNPNDPVNYQITCTAPYSPWYVGLVKAINKLYQPNGVMAVVDTACDAALYNPSNFVGMGLGGLHPNQAGQNEIAHRLLDTIHNPNAPPQADCVFLH